MAVINRVLAMRRSPYTDISAKENPAARAGHDFVG